MINVIRRKIMQKCRLESVRDIVMLVEWSGEAQIKS